MRPKINSSTSLLLSKKKQALLSWSSSSFTFSPSFLPSHLAFWTSSHSETPFPNESCSSFHFLNTLKYNSTKDVNPTVVNAFHPCTLRPLTFSDSAIQYHSPLSYSSFPFSSSTVPWSPSFSFSRSYSTFTPSFSWSCTKPSNYELVNVAASCPKHDTTVMSSSSSSSSSSSFSHTNHSSSSSSSFATQLNTSSLPSDSIRPLDCGEDAFFILNGSKYSILGIADGVGGWNELGIDPSLFAWELMNNCKRLANQFEFPDPKSLLSAAYNLLLEQKKVNAGSSTATLLTFDKQNCKLYSANLGDSGYLIIRRKHILHQSPCLQHEFNAPYQLSVYPETWSKTPKDSPQLAMVAQHELKSGDIIITATDGLFDNAFPSDILHSVLEHPFPFVPTPFEKKETPSVLNELQMLVNQLVLKAREFAVSETRMSPFAKSYFQATGQFCRGGKLDDITVMASLVVKTNEDAVTSV